MNTVPLEVTPLILNGLGPADLMSFAKVDRRSRIVADDFIVRAYSHRQILQPFLDTIANVKTFVRLMERTGLIISGSQALAFFFRTTFAGSDLDLYVGSKETPGLTRDVLDTLGTLGYKVTKKHDFASVNFTRSRGFSDEKSGRTLTIHTDTYVFSNIDKVYHLEDSRGRVIQVIVPLVGIMDAILSFHSTGVMNIITSSHAYCLYARATLRGKTFIHRASDDNERMIAALQKYQKRGFKSIDAANSTPLLDNRYRVRRVGDKRCWTIPLVSEPVSSNVKWAEIERNTWKLVCDFSVPIIPTFHFHYATYTSPLQSLCIADDLLIEMKAGPDEWTDEDISGFIGEDDDKDYVRPHMAFTRFKALPQDMRALTRDSRYMIAIRQAQSRKDRRGTCDISTYADAGLLKQHFVANTDTNDNFVFISKRSSDSEQVFSIRGTLSEVTLPPVRRVHGMNPDIGGLHQYVKITSSEQDPLFKDSVKGVQNILDLLTEAVPANIRRRVSNVTPGNKIPFLTFKTPLLSMRYRVHPSDIINIPEAFDPKGIMEEAIASSGKDFVMTKDNRVSYDLLKERDGEWKRVRRVDPEIFRPGQIVDLDATFRLLKLQNGAYLIACHIDRLTLVSTECQKILEDNRSHSKSQHPLPLPQKERGDNSSDHDDAVEDMEVDDEDRRIPPPYTTSEGSGVRL